MEPSEESSEHLGSLSLQPIKLIKIEWNLQCSYEKNGKYNVLLSLLLLF